MQMDTRDHSRVTQEDGSIDAALAWLSASMTALKKGDREKKGSKCEKKKIHRSFLNPVSLTDPKIRKRVDL